MCWRALALSSKLTGPLSFGVLELLVLDVAPFLGNGVLEAKDARGHLTGRTAALRKVAQSLLPPMSTVGLMHF